MEVLERIWDSTTTTLGSVGVAIERTITSLFGSANARYIRKLQQRVAAVNALEESFKTLTNDQLRGKTAEFKQRLLKGETTDDLLVEAFATARESGRRYLGMRHYDVQLIGGMILHSGCIAEMVTGEGKTLVATLPAYLNALEGRGCHVITVNDYLARRDMEWMGPLYMNLGLTVGAIQSGMDPDERQHSYACDITYGTNNEFGFDYLRDNMRPAARGDQRYPKQAQQAQGPLHFAIIDEVDNILVDEARTPLIIAGPAHDDVTRYGKADAIARQLKKDLHFEVKEKEHTVNLTDEGVRQAEQLAGVESFYTTGNMEWPHLIDNSLKAHYLYKRDVNYVVMNGEVVIVDEFTGRLMPGRNWSDGLHQAVEAKEGVRVKEENQTLATITLQNFFKLYKKICGMTGTAMTEANEFWKIYKLDVVAVPTNRGLQRKNFPDVIFRSEKEKWKAIADEIEQMNKWDQVELSDHSVLVGTVTREDEQEVELEHNDTRQREVVARRKVTQVQRRGRPILVGTVSIENSEKLSAMLQRRGIDHQVLNAKHHKREAEIIAQAGRFGAVTIATNMAGRGTDIILGGNPETMAWAMLQDKYATRLDVPQEEWKGLVEEIEGREQMKAQGQRVRELGGLHIIGTERHEARRIDLQLRGRCGRQGDPGSSRFYLSLEDDLMRIFGGEWMKNVLTRVGMKEGEAIISKMVSRRVEGAQKKVEERNFETRKNLLEYDEVMDEQRKRVYGYRQRILDGEPCKQLILEMIQKEVSDNVQRRLDSNYGAEAFAAAVSSELSVELESKEFFNLDFEAADRVAKDVATRLANGQVFDAIEENLPETEEQSAWNWEALAKFANGRWGTNYRDRDLKQIGRDGLHDELLAKAEAAIERADLTPFAKFLEENYSLGEVIDWVRHKFGLVFSLADFKGRSASQIISAIYERAEYLYREKEIEYPVVAGMSHFASRDAGGQRRYDRESLVEWATRRFGSAVTLEDIKNKQRDEIKVTLAERSRTQQAIADQLLEQVHERVARLFATAKTGQTAAACDAGELRSLLGWAGQELGTMLASDHVASFTHEQLERDLAGAVEFRYRDEIRRLERNLVLEVLDAAWKDHLLAMDHLRQSVGLRGYAQVDPKVEYKREGMRTFEAMWSSVEQRVTDLFFKIEDLDENFLNSTWNEGQAIHDDAGSATQQMLTQQQQEQQNVISNAGGDRKVEPIRNRDVRLGRNDPCHCGSGKKYKNCCMNK